MRILAIDSSGLVASVALVEEDRLVAEYTVNYRKTHSQTLLPMIDQICTMTEMDLHTLDAIAVSAGPGSFTGLRIGSATAKGLGLALELPLISVPTVDGLAYNLYGTSGLICPIMDARREQVYTGIYRWEGDSFRVIKPQTAISIQELADHIREQSKEGCRVIFLGDGVPVYREQFVEMLGKEREIRFAPAHLNRQRAGAIGVLACAYYREGKTETAQEHKPEYIRITQAERERAKRLRGRTHD